MLVASVPLTPIEKRVETGKLDFWSIQEGRDPRSRVRLVGAVWTARIGFRGTCTVVGIVHFRSENPEIPGNSGGRTPKFPGKKHINRDLQKSNILIEMSKNQKEFVSEKKEITYFFKLFKITLILNLLMIFQNFH